MSNFFSIHNIQSINYIFFSNPPNFLSFMIASRAPHTDSSVPEIMTQLIFKNKCVFYFQFLDDFMEKKFRILPDKVICMNRFTTILF